MDQNTLNILQLIGTWLAGIGTIGAVMTALHLARREAKINLKVSAGHRIIIGSGIETPPDYCSIYIVNKGFRKTAITNIGWKVGFLKKRYGIQQIDGNVYSSKVPVELSDGQEAKYLIPFENHTEQHHWIDEFPKSFLNKWPSLVVRTLKVQVFTSVGKTFESKIEKSLRDRLIESAKKQLTNKSSGCDNTRC